MTPMELVNGILAAAEDAGQIESFVACPGVPAYDVWAHEDSSVVQLTVVGEGERAPGRDKIERLEAEVESLRAENERLGRLYDAREAEVLELLRDQNSLRREREALAAEVESLRAAVARVRELHWRTVDETNAVDYTSCNECCDGEYPCPTIRALDGKDPS